MERLKVDGFERIYQVDCFDKEFEKATSEKRKDGRYHKWLRQRLMLLDDPKIMLNPDFFEPLHSTNPKLFSIRYPHSKKNPRIIYICVDRNEICLLHAFRETKTVDYDVAIKLAENRAKSFI